MSDWRARWDWNCNRLGHGRCLVGFKVRPALEDRIAWVLSGEVVLEVIASVESLRAEAALVGFLPGVVAHVPVAVGFGREAGAAVLAQVAAVLALSLIHI